MRAYFKAHPESLKNRKKGLVYSYVVTDLADGSSFKVVGAIALCERLKISPCTVSRLCNGNILRSRYKVVRLKNKLPKVWKVK